MWIILGVLTLIFMTTNLMVWYFGKDYRLTTLCTLSFMILTVCGSYSHIASLVSSTDFEVLNVTAKQFLVMTAGFVAIVGIAGCIPLFVDRRRAKTTQSKEV